VGLAGHLLDDDGHAFVVVDQAHLATVEQRIGVEHAGVDLGDRPLQIGQILLWRALVGAEDALVFAGKGGVDVVLQQAGGAHDQRRLVHPDQQLRQFRDDALGETPLRETLGQVLIVGDDLLRRLVFLVQMVQQAVDLQKFIEHIRADEEGLGDQQPLGLPADRLGLGAVQDLPGQHHAGGLAADLAPADAMAADVVQISHAEEAPGDADEGQLIADHGLDQHGANLLEVVAVGLPLGRRQRLILLALGKEHVPGRQLRVEAHGQLIPTLAADLRLDHLAQQTRRQVMAKVEVGQLVTNPPLAALPHLRSLLPVGIVESLALLGLPGLVLHLLLEHLARQEAARENLLTHAPADAIGQDRIVGQLQIDLVDLGDWQRGVLVSIHKISDRPPV